MDTCKECWRAGADFYVRSSNQMMHLDCWQAVLRVTRAWAWMDELEIVSLTRNVDASYEVARAELRAAVEFRTTVRAARQAEQNGGE
jgi:hypothetical protein